LLWHWPCRRHGNRNKYWVEHNYFYSIGGEDWVFQSVNAENGLQRLVSCKDIPIKHHIKIRSEANSYDPVDELYFDEPQVSTGKKVKCSEEE